jgi:hypothetical protein
VDWDWEFFDMDSRIRVPVTAAVFTAATVLLSGCIAYDAASTVVDVGATAVGAGAKVITTTGDIVTSPFDSGDSDKRK